MKYANLIVPFGSDNTTAIDFIVQNLLFRLFQHDMSKANKKQMKKSMHVQFEDEQKTDIQEQVDLKNKVSNGSDTSEDEEGKDGEPYKIDSLPFELVDYAVDYIGFKNKLTYYKPGDAENYKLETILIKMIENKMPDYFK